MVRPPAPIPAPLARLSTVAFRAVLGLALVSAAFGAGVARAEDAPPRKPRTNDGFRFSDPDEQPAAPATPGTGAPASARPTGPADPTDTLVRRLATWPGQDGIKAAESLLLMGPEALDPVRRAVAKGAPAVKPAAAWVLGKIGTTADVVTILTAAAERGNGGRLETFFEAAYELDAPSTKKWLFSFLTLDRPVFRARATEFLAGIVTADDRHRVDGLLGASSRQAGVRMAGLELLTRMRAADAPDRLVIALGDPHPDVARRAAVLLSNEGDAALVARLNGIVRDGDARERSYAMLSLVERCRRTRTNAFEPATVPALVGRRGLLHPDLLCRGASAVALVFGGLETTDDAIGRMLDHDVVTVLVETVGGDHFVDYGSVVEPAFAALRRITGEDLPATASPWAVWWTEQRDTFHARRTLARVTDDDVPRARVVFDVVDADGRRRRTAFVSESAAAAAGAAFVLPLPAFRALVDGVEDAGVFEGADDQRTLTDEHLAVRVVVANQERRLVLTPSRDDPRHGVLTARLEALEEENLWQRYRDAAAAPDAGAWRREQAQRFAGASPDERRERLLGMVAAAFDDLDGDGARLEAVELLDRHADRVTDADAARLLEWTTRQQVFGTVEARIVTFVASLGRPALGDALVEALARSNTPEAQRLLVRTLVDAGPERVREAFADPRPPVRVAGAAAAADLVSGPLGRDPTTRERLASILTEGLRALLVDADFVVRVRAAAALAILGEPKMLEKLDALYREGDVGAKIAVAQSLGRIGGDAVQGPLVAMIGEVGPQAGMLRAAALEGMAASHHPDAVRILAFYMLNDADAGVQQSAERAIVGLGTDDARRALVDVLAQGTLEPAKRARVVKALAGFDGAAVREILGRHLEDPDPGVVDEAALGLAAARDGVAVPYLLAILKRPEDALRPRAREALEDLTSLTIPVTSYEAVAEQYEGWYRSHRQGGDRAWFRDAVARKGYDTSALASYLHGDGDLAGVPVLLRTIRDDDPVLRRNSDLALRRLSGVEVTARIDRGTSREEARGIADRWASWWARQQKAGHR